MENLIKKNHMMWAVTFFLLMFAVFIYTRPSISFGPNGNIKPFGVQKRGSTIFPVWFWTAIFAAFSRILVSLFSRNTL